MPPIERNIQQIRDELLVLRCRRRDLAAWDELVACWNERLHYFLRRLIDHEHDAANVLQEVWLGAFRNIGNLKQDARLAPWLYTIARRAAMNHYRDRYAHDKASTDDIESLQTTSDYDEQLDFDNAELVHFGLGRLPLLKREILTLYFLDDLSVAEIATVLEIPAGTVKSRLWKARGSLRRILDEEAARHER
jgi:RNA polymerase sigma factor (sigma-70 family)